MNFANVCIESFYENFSKNVFKYFVVKIHVTKNKNKNKAKRTI